MSNVAGIYGRELRGFNRSLQVGIAQGRVLSVSFPAEVDTNAEPEHELLDRIEAYLNGEQDEFTDVTVALTVPTPQRKVLEALRTVPYGDSVSMEQLLRMTPGDHDPDEEAATVRNALAGNPAPILIPTHRVTDGPSTLPDDIARAVRSVEGL